MWTAVSRCGGLWTRRLRYLPILLPSSSFDWSHAITRALSSLHRGAVDCCEISQQLTARATARNSCKNCSCRRPHRLAPRGLMTWILSQLFQGCTSQQNHLSSKLLVLCCRCPHQGLCHATTSAFTVHFSCLHNKDA